MGNSVYGGRDSPVVPDDGLHLHGGLEILRVRHTYTGRVKHVAVKGNGARHGIESSFDAPKLARRGRHGE